MALKIKSKPKSDEFAQHLVSNDVVGKVNVSSKLAGAKDYSQITDSTEKVAVGIVTPKNELINITVVGAMTINLGNFESAKVGVSISLPCTKADLEDTYNFGTEWVSKKMEESVDSIKGSQK